MRKGRASGPALSASRRRYGPSLLAVTTILVVGSSVLGLMVGSFLNVVVHRVPRRESVVRPRSRCPSCGTELLARDNVPVLSWLLLRGRCRRCGTSISARYPAIELATGVLFAIAALRFGAAWELPAFLVFFAALLALSAVDLELYLLPNRILYPSLFLVGGLLLTAAVADGEWASLRDAAIGGAAAWAVFFAIHVVSPRGMGFGDVRLAGFIGVALGWLSPGHVFVGLFLAFLVATVVSLGLMAFKLRGRKDKVPFGPFLAAGAVLATVVGRPLLDWYLG